MDIPATSCSALALDLPADLVAEAAECGVDPLTYLTALLPLLGVEAGEEATVWS